jgi:hypothetical protein
MPGGRKKPRLTFWMAAEPLRPYTATNTASPSYKAPYLPPNEPQYRCHILSHAGLFPCNDMIKTRRPASALLSPSAVAYWIYD